MIKAKAKLSVKGKEKLAKLRERLAKSDGAYVTVGVHDGAGQYEDGTSVALVALCNEFGTEHIPERSFLRSALHESQGQINAWRKEALLNVIERDWDITKALTMIGMRTVILIQNKIRSNVPPPNAPSTQRSKERRGVPQRTLIDTTLLLRSVAFHVHVGTES